MVIGAGTRTAALTGAALLLSRAVQGGVVPGRRHHRRATGTRDLRLISGLGRLRQQRLTAVVAVASMIGLPPALGFVAKAVLAAFLEGGSVGHLFGRPLAAPP